ncbi:MAG: S8 family peptidase [Enterococcus faecalis]
MSKVVRISPIKKIKVLQTKDNRVDNLEKIKAKQLWNETEQGSGIVIAIIDSGIQIDHPSLEENIIDRFNFTMDDNGDEKNVTDYTGHGTHVAGIIAGKDIGNGVVGVAPKAKLLILKVIEKDGSGSYENVTSAIKFASDWTGKNGEKVSIINMSLGGKDPDDTLHRTIKVARRKGIILVSASGNNGDGDNQTVEVSFPGFYKEVIQIGSVDKDGYPSTFSNTNINLDFVAPGEDILSAGLGKEFVELTGTSMATPFVSGGIALILKTIDKTNEHSFFSDVYEYLVDHADPKFKFSINQVGNGFIQLK